MARRAEVVRRAVAGTVCSRRTVAADAGLSYDAVRAWSIGRREPTPENMLRLAESFERRADRLRALAAELREAAGSRPES